MKIFTITKTTMVFSDKWSTSTRRVIISGIDLPKQGGLFDQGKHERRVDFDFQGKPSLATVTCRTHTKDILHWRTKTTKYKEHFSQPIDMNKDPVHHYLLVGE